MSWTPILDGELATQAAAAARAIADDLATDETMRPIDRALFWPYAAAALRGPDDDAHDAAATDALVASLPTIVRPALYGGLAGVGWVTAHTTEGGDELLAIIDEALLRGLRASPRWHAEYDLISGLVGFAVYFLERGEAPAATAGLALIVDHLAALAEPAAIGTTWHTAPQLLPPHQRVDAPHGYHNAGLAHGVPGVLAVLARIAARPDAPPTAAILRDGADAWLEAQLGPTVGKRYPSMLVDGQPRPSRAAWCYGDPGVLVAQWQAATLSGRPIEPYATRLLDSIALSVDDAGVVDAGLCHGAAGLAHLANRAYQASGDERFRAAARRWFAETLAMRTPGDGLGGYRFHDVDMATLQPRRSASPDFLDGSAGVALALLAAIGEDEPGWDRLLLCDLPRADLG
jgi:hypothetical protein